MLNVNDDTIRAYTEHNVNKKLTISFPNDSNIKDITNDNIKEDSMNLLRSICSDSKMMVQGCIATEFKVTTFDINDDITNKNIVVSLSVKDDNYKGEWQEGVNYVEGDIVKFDGEYYKYNETPISTSRSSLLKRTEVNFNEWKYKESASKYALPGRSPERLVGVYIERTKAVPEGLSMFVRTWYKNGSYYGHINNLTSNYDNKDIIFAKSDSYGNSLEGWFSEVKCDDRDVLVDFLDSLRVYELTTLMEYELYPTKLDYCEKLYGYIDTSNTQDIVIFRGKIKSFIKQTSDPRYKDLTAYDKLYDFQSTSIKSLINTVDSNGKGYIELYDYQGKYTQNIEYKTNQVVYEDTTVNGKTVRYYYRFKRTYDFPSFKRMTLANVYTASINGTLLGTQYIQRLSNYYPNRPTFKTLRDGVCKYLGITQQSTTLFNDDSQLTIGKLEKEYSGQQMLQWICNGNLVDGYLDPVDEKIKYIEILKKSAVEDSNYKGEYSKESGTEYKAGDVVKFTNEYNETRYYECQRDLSNLKFIDEESSYPYYGAEVLEFMNVRGGYKYLPPRQLNNDWKIVFEFDNDLAEELGISISLGGISIKQSQTIYLNEYITNSYSIVVSKVNEKFWKTFKATLYTARDVFSKEWDLSGNVLKNFWKPKNLLYHPNGKINLSFIYEIENIELEDDEFNLTGRYITDEDGSNVLYGSSNSNKVSFTLNPLFKKWMSAEQLYQFIDAPEKYGSLVYRPFKLNSLGLPFLEPGDMVTFGVDKWSSDSDGNPVTVREQIDSVVFEKTMSGVTSLKDEYTAKKE